MAFLPQKLKKLSGWGLPEFRPENSGTRRGRNIQSMYGYPKEFKYVVYTGKYLGLITHGGSDSACLSLQG